MKHFLQFFILSLMSCTALAQIDQPKEIRTTQQFGDYTVHYNVFNTTTLPPAVTQAYKLVRGKNRVLVNISLTQTKDGHTTLGLPVLVSGVARNLMQQKQALQFIEINEGEATYYLAPFVFNNEEVMYFDIAVKTAQDAQPFAVEFNRTLYTEN